MYRFELVTVLINIIIALAITMVVAWQTGIRRWIGFTGVFIVMLVSSSIGELAALPLINVLPDYWFLLVRTLVSLLLAILAGVVVIKARE